MESQTELLIKLQNKLMRRAKRIGLDVTDEDISDEISDAINFVNNRRGFVPTSSCLYEEKYSSIIVDLALSAIAKYGAEGQISHSENGIGRSYENGGKYPYTLIMQIPPLARSPE